MESSAKTARELYEELKAKPRRRPFGFGAKPMIVNVDLQKAFTLEAEFTSAYSTHPDQMRYVNEISAAARRIALPVVWTYIAFRHSSECGVWGMRSDHPDALQNIRFDSRRAELDDRVEVDRARDHVIAKQGASAFFQTNLGALAVWHRVDTIVVTGGSTSGCVRATVVDGLQSGYRMIVPEECVDDRHESPHFASLYDMAMKYADVLPSSEVIAHLNAHATPRESGKA